MNTQETTTMTASTPKPTNEHKSGSYYEPNKHLKPEEQSDKRIVRVRIKTKEDADAFTAHTGIEVVPGKTVRIDFPLPAKLSDFFS